MMRSLYSGVSGLRVHQTRMDVIGNNIANVNTVGFKSSSVTFSDVLYQTSSPATGPNDSMGTAGVNAMQIGLGASLASITTKITGTGGSQRTDGWSDLMIEGDGFFVVQNNGTNYFTKAGSFNVDANGNLCTPSGALVMGWQVSEDDPSRCKSDTVSALRVMAPDKMFSEPAATTQCIVKGNIDQNDTQLAPDAEGRVANIQFYDNLGNLYTMELNIKHAGEDAEADAESNSTYAVRVANVYDEKGKSIFVDEVVEDGVTTYVPSAITNFDFNGTDVSVTVDEETGEVTIDMEEGATLAFDSVTGHFKNITGDADAMGDGYNGETNEFITFNIGGQTEGDPFQLVTVDFSALTMFSQSGTTTLECARGTRASSAEGAGKPVGNMTGISIDKYGKIYGSYDNGDSNLLGQVVVATFPNAAGLEAVGNNMFATTQNSGSFDGIGKDILTTGGKFNPGVIEMSNVDLANEFTDMIITQRGFQANSRIITTSDTLLEELINLKR